MEPALVDRGPRQLQPQQPEPNEAYGRGRADRRENADASAPQVQRLDEAETEQLAAAILEADQIVVAGL